MQVVLTHLRLTKVSVLLDAPVKMIHGDLLLIIMVYFRVLWDAPEEDSWGSVA